MDRQPKSVGVTAPVCIECSRRWLEHTHRWRAYLTDDDPPQVVLYCEECAAREFDE